MVKWIRQILKVIGYAAPVCGNKTNKEAIIQATIRLIEENGEHLEEVTVREICKKSRCWFRLVNYHFGNKDKLIEQCIERMINGIVERIFRIYERKTDGLYSF